MRELTRTRQQSRRAARARSAARLVLSGWLACGLAIAPVAAQAPAEAPAAAAAAQAAAAPAFKPEEIDALVAPIALYPDSVLAQVLMASTYPLEIVLAYRWMKANPSMKGEAAVAAIGDKPWDVSVKSLVAFPQILEPMNDKLDWTQRLGDAFLAQQKDVMDAVQRLRGKANESGNLKTTEQQNVIVEPPSGSVQQTVIRIEPANPEVVYLPAYDPTVVYGYGYWGYGYAPYYWPPYPAYYPGYAFGAGIAFGVGLAVAGAIFGGITWGGGGNVNINVNRAANIDRNFDRNKVDRGRGQGGQGGNARWQHDASHRQGVAYRDNATRQKFGQGGVGGADARAGFRGREGGFDGRGGGFDGRGGGGDAGRGAIGSHGGGPRGDGGGASGGRSNAFQGVGGGSASQRDFSRGNSTAQRSSMNRPSGGMGGAHGGGGRGGGGRGGGGRR